MQRPWNQEFVRVLNTVEGPIPAGKVNPASLGNDASERHGKVLKRPARHPRFVFTPTAAPWLNAVENFVPVPIQRRLKDGSFRSIVDLETAINRYLAGHDDGPKPFTWTTTASQILAKLSCRNTPIY